MAELSISGKPLAVSPLKVSQAMGAALAFLGLARAMPLEHGARGCTSLSKLFFMRHFREPIALQTTAMEQLTTILGADDNVVEALHTVCTRERPEVIGLINTGLAETQGADIPSTLRVFRDAHPEFADVAIVPVSASDQGGGLEVGFAAAVEAIIDTLLPMSRPAPGRLPTVNVLASPMLTPGDIEAIREWIEAFGLRALVLPDLAASLDGHLIEAGFFRPHLWRHRPFRRGGDGVIGGDASDRAVLGPCRQRDEGSYRHRRLPLSAPDGARCLRRLYRRDADDRRRAGPRPD